MLECEHAVVNSMFVFPFIAKIEEEDRQQESGPSSTGCEKGWTEEDCQPIVREAAKELWHW